MTEIEFKYHYMWYHLNEGNSFDPWGVMVAWNDYTINPEKFNYLFKKEPT